MFKNLILYIWQLPQHMLALILIRFSKAEFDEKYQTSRVYRTKKLFGISLGQYIIMNTHHDYQTIQHEYGHSIQSLYFGPLYLLIVGLPSITMNIISRIDYRFGNKKFYYNYYNRWPENWADKLGGVNRRDE